MNCPKCQHENPPQALLCLKCGRELPSAEAASLGNQPTLRPEQEPKSLGRLADARPFTDGFPSFRLEDSLF
jgi:hypothetical protein